MALQYLLCNAPVDIGNTSWTRSSCYLFDTWISPELGLSSGVIEEWVEGGALAKLSKRFGSGRFLG
jgi:hypothetical protein